MLVYFYSLQWHSSYTADWMQFLYACHPNSLDNSLTSPFQKQNNPLHWLCFWLIFRYPHQISIIIKITINYNNRKYKYLINDLMRSVFALRCGGVFSFSTINITQRTWSFKLDYVLMQIMLRLKLETGLPLINAILNAAFTLWGAVIDHLENENAIELNRGKEIRSLSIEYEWTLSPPCNGIVFRHSINEHFQFLVILFA